jgi:biopolymer transport protein ExbB
MRDSIWEVMSHGYGTMWVLLALSVISVGVAVERTIAQYQFTKRAQALAETVGRCLRRGALSEARSACERSPSPLADVFLVGYERHGRVRGELVSTATHRERQRVNGELRQRLWILGTIGALAPFIGLAGTVLGIMVALDGFEGAATVKFDEVSGPISDALIATAAGIVVAIESVVFYNFFSQRSAQIAVELKLLTDEFLEDLGEAPEAEQKDGKDARDGKKEGGGGRSEAA